MESCQAMKLAEYNKDNLNDMLNIQNVADSNDTTNVKRRSSKFVEKAFANLFINEMPKKKASTKQMLKSKNKKLSSFKMKEMNSNNKIATKALENIELLNLIENTREMSTPETSTPDSDLFIESVDCPCVENHPGKETLNKIMPNVSVTQIYEALFTKSKFLIENWKIRKLFDVKIKEWEKSDENTMLRHLEYKIDLGPLGNPVNFEVQTMLTNRPNECICIESNVKTQGILYSDYFTVVNRYCITRNDANSSRLIVSSYINYIKNPNFIAKTFIERNVMSNLNTYYDYLELNLPKLPPSISPSQSVSTPQSEINHSLELAKNKKHIKRRKSSNKLFAEEGNEKFLYMPNEKPIAQDPSNGFVLNTVFSFSIRYEVIFMLFFLLIILSILLDIGMFIKLNEAEKTIDRFIYMLPKPQQHMKSNEMKSLVEDQIKRVKKIEISFMKHGMKNSG